MPTTEVKDRKAFIRVGISLAKKSIATASQAESEQKKTKAPRRKGAVGFIDWLDFRALLRDEFIIKLALAAYHLPAANWTSFYVTTEDVNLAFPDAAVVTGLPIGSPVLFLISIANAVEFLASNAKARLNRVVYHGLINLTRRR